jgi:hypothetical protein
VLDFFWNIMIWMLHIWCEIDHISVFKNQNICLISIYYIKKAGMFSLVFLVNNWTKEVHIICCFLWIQVISLNQVKLNFSNFSSNSMCFHLFLFIDASKLDIREIQTKQLWQKHQKSNVNWNFDDVILNKMNKDFMSTYFELNKLHYIHCKNSS